MGSTVSHLPVRHPIPIDKWTFNADGFSHLPLRKSESEYVTVFNLGQIELLPIDMDKLRKTTSIDPKVVLYTQRGWPRQTDDKLMPYANRQSELSVEAGCLLWWMRVVVPTLCQEAVLRELHTSHPGIVGINKNSCLVAVTLPAYQTLQAQPRVKSCSRMAIICINSYWSLSGPQILVW